MLLVLVSLFCWNWLGIIGVANFVCGVCCFTVWLALYLAGLGCFVWVVLFVVLFVVYLFWFCCGCLFTCFGSVGWSNVWLFGCLIVVLWLVWICWFGCLVLFVWFVVFCLVVIWFGCFLFVLFVLFVLFYEYWFTIILFILCWHW